MSLPITGGSCHNCDFCRDKHTFVATSTCFVTTNTCFVATNTCFVATKTCLSQGTHVLSRHTHACHNEHRYNKHRFCRDKHMPVTKNTCLVATNTCLYFCRDKNSVLASPANGSYLRIYVCRDKHMPVTRSICFVATNTCLSQRTHVLSPQTHAYHNEHVLSPQTHACRDKHKLVATNTRLYFCRDKTVIMAAPANGSYLRIYLSTVVCYRVRARIV